jgi:hypothetical protein
MDCQFTQNGRFPPQAYEGALNTVGDIGVTAGGVLAFGVLAPTAGPPPGHSPGTYLGATGEIGVGSGCHSRASIMVAPRTTSYHTLYLSHAIEQTDQQFFAPATAATPPGTACSSSWPSGTRCGSVSW